jgi:hypothetical protein
MKIGIVIAMLTTMDPNKEAFVHFSKADNTGSMFEILGIFDAQGDAQIDIAEETDEEAR